MQTFFGKLWTPWFFIPCLLLLYGLVLMVVHLQKVKSAEKLGMVYADLHGLPGWALWSMFLAFIVSACWMGIFTLMIAQ